MESNEKEVPMLAVPELSDLDVAFPAHALDWMPPMAEIPVEFKRWRGTTWNKIVDQWFFAGFPYMVRGEAIHIARALEAVR